MIEVKTDIKEILIFGRDELLPRSAEDAPTSGRSGTSPATAQPLTP